MGNSSDTHTKPSTPPYRTKKNRNSYSLDNVSFQQTKIKPVNLQSMISVKGNESQIRYGSAQKQNQQNNIITNQPIQNYEKRISRSSGHDKKLSKLTSMNDQLRHELIKISSQLTQKVKKKRFVPKINTQKKQEPSLQLKRQLQNAYRQIEFYKKRILDYKNLNDPVSASVRMQKIQNETANVDVQIIDILSTIEGLKNVKGCQEKAMVQAQEKLTSPQYAKQQIADLKEALKNHKKKQRQKQQKEKKMQDYMYQIQRRYRQINGDYVPQKKPKKAEKTEQKQIKQVPKSLPNSQQIGNAEGQLAILKLKQQQYKRKINYFQKLKSDEKDRRMALQKDIKKNQQNIENLKTKKQMLEKLYKAYEQKMKLEAMSQISDNQVVKQQSQSEEEQNGFKVNHLKADIPKPPTDRQASIILTDKSIPKKWEKKITRIIQKGLKKQGQKTFDDSKIITPKNEQNIYIVGMQVYLTKKKRLLGFKALYKDSETLKQGQKSSYNDEQFVKKLELGEGDYIKSVIAFFGKQKFLQYIVLSSKNGVVGKFGREPDESERISCGMAANEKIIALNGASSRQKQSGLQRVNRLAVQICLFS